MKQENGMEHCISEAAYCRQLDGIETAAQFLQPGTFAAAFAAPTVGMQKAYLDHAWRRAVVLGVSDEAFEQAVRAAHRQAGGGQDVFGRSRKAPANGLAGRFATMDTVEERKAEYLIAPYLPKGMLAIMGGISGVGKTFLVLSWAAAVSRGQRLPFQHPFDDDPPQGYVYYFTQENDPNTVIKPRLRLLGADMSRIVIQSSGAGCYEQLTLSDPVLEQLAAVYPPALVIFDPIQSYLGTGVGMDRANEVRPILDWLGDYAKRHGCAVVLISHMSKPGANNTAALDRLLGSSDFRNAARSIIVVGRDPEDANTRVFAHGKNSIGRPGPSQRYHIDSQKGVVYDGECQLTDDQIVRQGQPGQRTKASPTLKQACSLLEDLLNAGQGAADYKAVLEMQEKWGISTGTLSNARKMLGLTSVRVGQPPRQNTWWLCAEIDRDQFKRDHMPPPKQLDFSKYAK